jgi:hypothetical protein
VAGCPSGAISAKHFEDRQIFAEIEGIFSGLEYKTVSKPKG